MIAALKTGRNSIGVETDSDYCRMAARYLKAEASDFFSTAKLVFEKATVHDGISINEDHELYNVCPAKKRLELG